MNFLNSQISKEVWSPNDFRISHCGKSVIYPRVTNVKLICHGILLRACPFLNISWTNNLDIRSLWQVFCHERYRTKPVSHRKLPWQLFCRGSYITEPVTNLSRLICENWPCHNILNLKVFHISKFFTSCIYIYIYTYIHTYTHTIHISIHTHTLYTYIHTYTHTHTII